MTIELGLRHPEHLVGVHFSAFYLYPPPEPWPEPVQKFMDWAARRSAEDGAYSRMQSTKPQTVAFGVTDSPAGIAAWIVDLFRSFSDTRVTSSPASAVSGSSRTSPSGGSTPQSARR